MTDKLQTVIFLIRHGDTDLPYSSNPLVDNERILTEEGRAQLKRVGDYLKAFDPAVIFYSPRKRTEDCAAIIKRTVASGVQMVEEKRLIEIYDNQQYLALDKKMPAYFG